MQLKYHIVTIEALVPTEHFLRKLEAALDLSVAYEETAHLYSRRYGRPPIDPVVMVKYLLMGFLYGIPSERQIEQRCADSSAFRWYLGIDLDGGYRTTARSASFGGGSPRFGTCSAIYLRKWCGNVWRKGL